MIYGNIVHTSTVLMTRQRAQDTGFFNEDFRTGEDYDFHLRSCRAGPSALIDAPAIGYRIAGGSDQLTHESYMLEMALNGLRTQEAAIARDRERVNLSNAEVADILESANAWVASELFDAGEFIKARPYYRRSWKKTVKDPRTFFKAVITHFPSALADSSIKFIRAKK
jgi:hypothetical protein